MGIESDINSSKSGKDLRSDQEALPEQYLFDHI